MSWQDDYREELEAIKDAKAMRKKRLSEAQRRALASAVRCCERECQQPVQQDCPRCGQPVCYDHLVGHSHRKRDPHTATRDRAADVVGLAEEGARLFDEEVLPQLRAEFEGVLRQMKAKFAIGYRNGVLDAYLEENL